MQKKDYDLLLLNKDSRESMRKMQNFSKKRLPIGVFDSGIGGLTALRKLAELLPNEDLIYLGDTARVPYGNRSPQTINLYAQQSVEFLLERSVKFILVACNTISAVAMAAIEQISPVPVIGVIKPAVVASLADPRACRIGIIGTRTTIQSQAYEREIRAAYSDRGVEVYTSACPLFVPLVEEGLHEHEATYAIAREYLQPLVTAKIQSLILGCTHYPLLKKVIQDIMPEVRLIDSGEEAAVLVAERLSLIGKEETFLPRTIDCYVTDLTATSIHLAQQFLGLPKEAVHQVNIGTVFPEDLEAV